MSTILYNAPAHAWLNNTAAESLWGRDFNGASVTASTVAVADRSPEYGEADEATAAERSAVVTLSGVPKHLRAHVERALVVCLRSQSSSQTTPVSDLDALFSDWFMRWSRDRSVQDYYALRCRQVLTATEPEFHALSRVLGGLADEHDFFATVRLMD